MADYGTLFALILVALTFVIVGMCFIVYIMIIGEREKRIKAHGTGPPRDASSIAECPHQFGYLNGYPLDQPIPEECFGCVKAIQCMNQKTLPIKAEAVASGEEQVD